jgi:L-ribulose-5-phosphate 3-epimerase
MFLGYNTNGLADHAPAEALALLAEIGYRSMALTIDHGLLNPFAGDLEQAIDQMRRLLDRHQLRSVIETGARFLLDPRQKHEPTLVSRDPAQRCRRVLFLLRAIDIAAALGSDCVSFWSGAVRDGASQDEALERLVGGLREVIDYAGQRGVVLGFEPEPGMLIDSMARYEQLLRRIDAPHFRLTLDIGHLHCQGETPIAEQIRRWAPRLVNVHIEDTRFGVHEHLMFGEGEIDFPPVIAALHAVGYRGGVHVELSRHSHVAPEAARAAWAFLHPLVAAARDGKQHEGARCF